MTPSRRLTEIHHRTHMLRNSTVPAAMGLIHNAGLTSHPIEGGAELIADKFEFYPAIGWWRSIDGKQRGYTARTLIAAAKVS